MSKFLVSLLFLALTCPAAIGAAQAEISEADRQAVAAYTEATAAVEEKMREARKEIRDKNSALAKVLGQEKAAFKEAEAIAAHKALTEAYAKITEAELEDLLLYKAYHPEWKPEADGRRVAVPGERREQRRADTAKDAPQEKKAK